MPVLCLWAIAKKDIGTKNLMKLHPFLQLSTLSMGHLDILSCLFGATVAGDVFQCKLDQCFGHLKNVIVIADDIMIVDKKPIYSDHDQALTTLLETARICKRAIELWKIAL